MKENATGALLQRGGSLFLGRRDGERNGTDWNGFGTERNGNGTDATPYG